VVKLSISLKIVVVVLLILVLALTFVNISLLSTNSRLLTKQKLASTCNVDASNSDNQLLSPDLAWLNIDVFLEKQNTVMSSYGDLEKTLSFVLDSARGDYSLYFEDLTTGAHIGIREQEKFAPLSLLKVPLMIATLKEIEMGVVSLNQKVVLDKEDIDFQSGKLWEKGAGYEITVKDLLIYLIKYSDNTAVYALNRHVVSEKYVIESRLLTGLSSVSNITVDDRISPQGYSDMLRGLYFSNYLRKPFSELGLALMSDTDFNSQLPAGLPKNIRVAHKVGVYATEGYYHDCGIIYVPGKPYLLCVMSNNTDSGEADKIISEVSKIVYEYVTANTTAVKR